jgi:exosortase A
MNPSNPMNSSNPFRTALLKSAITVACLVLLYFRVAQGLVSDWLHLPDFSHGFLIPIVSFYFVYERRKELSVLSPSTSWGGFGLIVFGILLLLLGNLATEYFTMRFSILLVLGGIILFLLGKESFKTLLFPIVFLIFMIPIPSILMDRITFPMQLFASKVAGSSLYLIGIPALREGNVILLANTSLEVAEACSGIRSLISLLALSVVFAYFSQKTTLKKVLLILSTFPISIIANAARVTGTGILAHHYGDKVAQGFFHGFSGWILFVVAFVCLFVVGSLLSRARTNKV